MNFARFWLSTNVRVTHVRITGFRVSVSVPFPPRSLKVFEQLGVIQSTEVIEAAILKFLNARGGSQPPFTVWVSVQLGTWNIN